MSKHNSTGGNIKYPVEDDFVMSAITHAWETGNLLSRSGCDDLLLSEYGSSGNEWSTMTKICSGSITPALSQWLSRILARCGFSMRKESIPQTVPLNWTTIALEACGIIRETMATENVTRLVNMDEIFLNFYPKEFHLIAPINSKRVGSNRGEDAKKDVRLLLPVKCSNLDF